MRHFKKRMLSHFSRWGFIVRSVAIRFWRENYMYKASALVYTTLLSLIPLLTVLFSLILASPVFNRFGVGQKLKSLIFANFIPATGGAIQQYLDEFLKHAVSLSAISLGGLVVTALLLLKTIENSFNEVWHVQQQRTGVTAFARYWVMITLAPILLGFGLMILTYVFSLPLLYQVLPLHGLAIKLAASLPTLVSLLGFTLLYLIVPNCKVHWRDAFCGGVVATILFECAKWAFVGYIAHFSVYQLVYGALAAIPVFLVWVFLLWLIVLIGALFAYAASIYLNGFSRCRLDGFSHAIIWLGFFWQAQQDGEELSLSQLIQKSQAHYQVEPAEMIHVLSKAGFIVKVHSGAYVLHRDLSIITVSEVYAKLPWRLPLAAHAELPEAWQKKAVNQVLHSHQEMMAHLAFPLAKLYA